MADKLHIPGPDQEEDLTELDITIVIGWAICMLICIALFLFFRGRRPEPEAPKPDDPVKARQLEVLDQGRRGYDELDFADEDQGAVAVFRHGPREAAEAACADLAALLENGELTHAVQLELLKTVDRRAEHAPWACLMRTFLGKKMSPDLDLFAEMAEFWKEVQSFEAPAPIVSSALEEFRQSRRRPEHEEFYHWLRVCGLNPSYGAREACLKLMYQLTPHQGEDLLAAAETHFRERQPEALQQDAAIIVDGLSELAQNGQPEAWRVTKSRAVDNYDDAIRIGATFVLCRLVNSPDEKVARPAALQAAEVATVAARATDDHLLDRWRETCGLAFAESTDEGAKRPAAALAVWDGVEEHAPKYSLAWAEARGDCPESAGRPAWTCGLGLWQGGEQELDLALMGYFTDTRHVEWAEE